MKVPALQENLQELIRLINHRLISSPVSINRFKRGHFILLSLDLANTLTEPIQLDFGGVIR